MSYYTHICQVCPDKQWIKPGTVNDPRHESAKLDEQHVATPASVVSVFAQNKMLSRAMQIILEHAPTAVRVDLQTSDQDEYGFVLEQIYDAAGNPLLGEWGDIHHPLAALLDDVTDELGDLEWDSVVGENARGAASLDPREYDKPFA